MGSTPSSDGPAAESGMRMIPHVRLTLFEVVLLAGAAVATLAYVVSESTLTVTIVSVAVLAVVALFRDTLR